MESFLFVAVVAAVVTLPVVRLIPRARQSNAFDMVLWFATWLLAFFMASSAPTYFPADSPLKSFEIVQVAVIPTFIGAMVGALLVNVPLWIIDRFSAPVVDDEPEMLMDSAEQQMNPTTPETLNEIDVPIPAQPATDTESS